MATKKEVFTSKLLIISNNCGKRSSYYEGVDLRERVSYRLLLILDVRATLTNPRRALTSKLSHDEN